MRLGAEAASALAGANPRAAETAANRNEGEVEAFVNSLSAEEQIGRKADRSTGASDHLSAAINKLERFYAGRFHGEGTSCRQSEFQPALRSSRPSAPRIRHNAGMPRAITPQQFVDRWKGRDLTERAAAQSHFNDLCDLLGVPKPTDDPSDDSEYCFEARTEIVGAGAGAGDGDEGLFGRVVASEGRGFCDVWKKGCFCWEYKRPGKHKDLAAALKQLKDYKDALDNPPLLIVSDIDTYEIHTNFTGHPAERYRFHIDDLAEPSEAWRSRGVAPLTLLKRAFEDPEKFRPRQTSADITEDLAGQIGDLADRLRREGVADRNDRIAHPSPPLLHNGKRRQAPRPRHGSIGASEAPQWA